MSSSVGSGHSVYENDPKKLKQYIGKYVSIKTCKDKIYKGFIKCIDPVSESIILQSNSNQGFQTSLFFSQSLRDIDEIEKPEGIAEPPNLNNKGKMQSEEFIVLKNNLLRWLSKNMLPVKENGNTIEVHDGSVVIYPPYRKSDCFSENTIILGRLQHLVEHMPD